MLRDFQYLQQALRIAARHEGSSWPNPSVGCVLVNDDRIVGVGVSGIGGRPHAETQALAMAGADAKGATAYTTLEPCAHHGKTPPCAEALIAAGVTRVVIGITDPDPRVAGKGMEKLQQAGIATELLNDPDCDAIHQGFFRRTTHGLPFVTMKLATSADGQMADATGERRWITGELARRHAHLLRARMNAVLTGIGTVLADDPMLNARAPISDNAQLVRVVLDSQLRLPLSSQLVKTAEQYPLWVFTTAEGVERAASHATDLRERGVHLHVPEHDRLEPLPILKALGTLGINQLLVEAGPVLSTSFLSAHAVDRLYWYRAPVLLGNAGASAISALHSQLEQASEARRTATRSLGEDICELYELESCLPG